MMPRNETLDHGRIRGRRGVALRLRRLQREPLCRHCREKGIVRQAVTPDHIVPLSQGGTDTDDNIQCLCAECHDAKTTSEQRGYSKQIGQDGWPVDASHPANGGQVAPPKTRGRMSHPDWFRKVHVPLTIVCGPPAAGKTSYVRAHAAAEDLVIDLDEIAARMRPASSGRRVAMSKGELADALRLRNEMLGDLMRATARPRWPRAWLIVGEPTPERRQWWVDHLKPDRVVVIATPEHECRRRAEEAMKQGDTRGQSTLAYISQWWSQYQPRAGDEVVQAS